jgi:hypothetical protein
METTKTNGAFIESVKMAEKWFSDTNATMMEIYNKQLNLTTGYYNNMFNSLINNNKGWKDGQMTDSFLKNDVSKWFPISFSGNGNSTNLSNPLQSLFDTMYKQMTEYNQNILANFNSQFNNSNTNWDTVSKEYKETVEKRLDASKKILNSISEGYMKELDSTMGNNKKLIDEINEQFNSVIKQNQKFWSEALKPNQMSVDQEDKKSKESNPIVSKKQSNSLVVS